MLRKIEVSFVAAALALSCGGRELGEGPFATQQGAGGATSAGGATPTTGGREGRGGAKGSGGAKSVGGAKGSGGTRTSGGAGANGSGGAGTCSYRLPLAPQRATIEFLTDTSLSMKRRFSNEERTRWDVVQAGLVRTFDLLLPDRLAGVACYPNIQLSAGSPVCFLAIDTVPIAPVTPEQRKLVRDALAAKVIFGATPTEEAYVYALDRLAASGEIGSRYIVLTTDGAPTYGANCSGTGDQPVDTLPLRSRAAAAVDLGVKTFVVGLGVPEENDWMSALAKAGDTAHSRNCESLEPGSCHYQVRDEGDALDQITKIYLEILERARPCRVRLDGAADVPRPARAVSVDTSDGATYAVSVDGPPSRCLNGAYQPPGDFGVLELCGPLCESPPSVASVNVEAPCR